MPFDGSTYTKPDVFSTVALRDWLRTQDPKRVYCYTDVGHCLIAQYLTAAGIAFQSVGGYGEWSDASGATHQSGDDLHQIAIGRPRTFGAALSRAEDRVASEA